MDGEANLPAPSATDKSLSRPIVPDSHQSRSITSSSSSSSSSFYSSSPPDFLRHVQAAFKRHRPLGISLTTFRFYSQFVLYRIECNCKSKKLGFCWSFGVSSNFDVKDVLTTCEQVSLFLTDCRSIITQIDISFNFGYEE